MALKPLPETLATLLVRTDFSDNNAWESVCETIKSWGDSTPLEYVNDIEYSNASVEQIMSLVPANEDQSAVVLADQATFSTPENLLLVVDLEEERGRTFRAIPNEIHPIVCNLFIANIDFSELIYHTDGDGVYRGVK